MGYRILETEDIPAYLRERGHWDDTADISVREVSDGNMNRVFLASTETAPAASRSSRPCPGCGSRAPPGR